MRAEVSVSINEQSFPRSAAARCDARKELCSSVSARSGTLRRCTRPKSTPIKLSPSGLDMFYLAGYPATVSASSPTTQSLRDPLMRPGCLSTGPSPWFRSVRAKEARPHTVHMDKEAIVTSDKMAQVYSVGPGYTINRIGPGFTVHIDSDEFFGPRQHQKREDANRKRTQDHKDILIAQLEEQIQNLTVYLEEEKLNHNLSIMKCQEQLDLTRATLIDNYTGEMEQMKTEHEQLLKRTRMDYDGNLFDQRREFEERLMKIEQELLTSRASFASFRQALIRETNEKFEAEKKEMLDEFDVQLSDKLNKQSTELKYLHDADLENITQAHSTERNKMAAKHKAEIEALNRRFAGAALVEENLSRTIQDLEKRKRDLKKLQTDYDSLQKTYSESRRELTIALIENEDLKGQVHDLSSRFEERVGDVNDSYKHKMDCLQNNVVEIRRAYMAKCDELVKERNHSDAQIHQRVKSAKNIMKEVIQTRERARISLVNLDADSVLETANKKERGSHSAARRSRTTHHESSPVHKDRPPAFSQPMMRSLSAPTTRKDDKLVKAQSVMINQDLVE